MNEVKKTVGESIDWDNLSEDPEKIKRLWSLRESIVALSLLTADRIIELGNSSASKTISIVDGIERQLVKDRAEAIILGSTTLLSDIDITIQSLNASVHISLIEDLWASTRWFNHSLWKVDLYGDFTTIGKYYMDTNYLTKHHLSEMLVLATASYFRHENSSRFDTSVLEHIISIVIHNEGLGLNVVKVLNDAKAVVASLKTSSREVYYEELAKAELYKSKILAYFGINGSDSKLREFLGDCIISEGYANLHREENYILPSTVIHVVKIEQGKEDIVQQCKPLRATLARCSMSDVVYILSAIEQLGYMQENLTKKDKEVCNMPAGKYFGRLMRALKESGIFDNSKDLPAFLLVAAELAKEKKRRGNAGNKNLSCDVDLFKAVKSVVNAGLVG
jgi:hypothetical protein